MTEVRDQRFITEMNQTAKAFLVNVENVLEKRGIGLAKAIYLSACEYLIYDQNMQDILVTALSKYADEFATNPQYWEDMFSALRRYDSEHLIFRTARMVRWAKTHPELFPDNVEEFISNLGRRLARHFDEA